jgi:beta-phosphoglucomutase
MTRAATKPAGVILDFDGVIADSLPVHLAAWGQAVERLFRRPLTDPESLVGRGTRAIAGLLATRYGDPSLGGELARLKMELLLANAGALPLHPGAREMAAALKEHGIPFGVATNAAKAFVGPVLAAVGLDFPVVMTRDDVSRGKPAPDVYIACANALRIAPDERPRVLVFEDSAHGIAAAVAARMTPVGVATDQDPEPLLAAGAVVACANLADALARGWLTDFERFAGPRD